MKSITILGILAGECRPANLCRFFIFLIRFRFFFRSFHFAFKKPGLSVFLGGRAKPPQTPSEQSSSAFDRGGQTGPPRSNAFFSAPLTTRAPPTTSVRTSGRTFGRPDARPNAAGRTTKRTLTKKIRYDYSKTPKAEAPLPIPKWEQKNDIKKNFKK